MYFKYTDKEINYLKNKDSKLKNVIETLGHPNREIVQDLFEAIVTNIIAQQISTKAYKTIWNKLREDIKEVNADNLIKLNREQLQSYGLSYKKVDYILEFANKVKNKEIDLDSLKNKTDDEIITILSSLNGIGVWTAQMILIHSLQRPNVFSYQDLGIQRGLRMVYHHRKITKKLFEKYQKRFSPYCSIASIYLWEVSAGAIPELKDHLPKSKIKK